MRKYSVITDNLSFRACRGIFLNPMVVETDPSISVGMTGNWKQRKSYIGYFGNN